jgi:hypothetical protein
VVVSGTFGANQMRFSIGPTMHVSLDVSTRLLIEEFAISLILLCENEVYLEHDAVTPSGS